MTVNMESDQRSNLGLTPESSSERSANTPQYDEKKEMKNKGAAHAYLRLSLSSTPSVMYLMTVLEEVRSSNRIA